MVLFPTLHELVSCYQSLLQKHQAQQQLPSQQHPRQQQQQQQQQMHSQSQQPDIQHLEPQVQQQDELEQPYETQPNDIELQMRHQLVKSKAMPGISQHQQAGPLQSSGPKPVSSAKAQQGADEYTDSLVADLQARIGPGDFDRYTHTSHTHSLCTSDTALHPKVRVISYANAFHV